jgi:hypothetical protein
MPARPLTRRQAALVCVTAALTVVMCAGVCAAAILVPAPAAVVPVVAVVCIFCPMLAAWELPGAIAALRAHDAAGHEKALARMRRRLERLPETEHPLGL